MGLSHHTFIASLLHVGVSQRRYHALHPPHDAFIAPPVGVSHRRPLHPQSFNTTAYMRAWLSTPVAVARMVVRTMSMHYDNSTHIWQSFHAVLVSVSPSQAATQNVVHPRTIASTRDNRYQSAHRTQQHNTSYTHTRQYPRGITGTRYIQLVYPLVGLI